ncbi:uncharacterized protein MCYG_06112 [Microsporum canis CBS 113480]|uniref:Uncharacterized protein n=1 Tax=Arthroderma otae (strain ATCC MYA-4605 / CBS 113480) TaxID=554155 RepID=C5FTU0_ARTOC|nr:uncharacterized protein MCYG_06112 [Microsporum canis CBS 113480]EEQ33293.1 predicted protein [Microsporum canis CBS 113480]
MNGITDPESLEPATTYMLFFLKLIQCKDSLVSSGHMMRLMFRPFDHVMLNKVVLSKSIKLLPCALPALVRLNASHMSQHHGVTGEIRIGVEIWHVSLEVVVERRKDKSSAGI